MSVFTTTLILQVYFSKRLAILLLILHGGTILLLIPLTIEFVLFIKLGLGVLIVGNAIFLVRRHLLFINHPLYKCRIIYNEKIKAIQIFSFTGHSVKIISAYSHPQLVILRCRINNNKVNLIIFADAIDVCTFRQLRVYLRHKA
ncbi:MAG: hypothetical protein KAH84_01395 [Thiomargarita sp.]|nr:hypothetical protein [Thiomargarita sp.]